MQTCQADVVHDDLQIGGKNTHCLGLVCRFDRGNFRRKNVTKWTCAVDHDTTISGRTNYVQEVRS